jgi:thiol-disulfide isomerase/thioredoxin
LDIAPSGGAAATTGATPRAAATIDPAKVADLRAAAGLERCPEPSSSAGATAGEAGGSRLPSVVLACLGEGPDVDLGALTGAYVVNVWGSWCGECRDEAPYFAEVYADPNRQVEFLGIDYLDDPARGLHAAAELGMAYASVWSDDDSLRAPLRIVGAPITLFVRDGAILGRHDGPFTSSEDLRAAIDEHLG